MFQYQTLACLQDIPVIRSSATLIQNAYTKAKNTNALIRVPCNVAEFLADKSFKIAATVTNPLVKPLSGSVHVIDQYAAQKIRDIESKYPLITSPTEEVVNTFNEKTEPVRYAVNSVKQTTTCTLQQGKETVSNVASATVNKATGVADSIYSFCGTRMTRIQNGKYLRKERLIGCFPSATNEIINIALQSIQTALIWCRIITFFFLRKLKQLNDILLTNLARRQHNYALPQRFLVISGRFLDDLATRVRPDDRSIGNFQRSGRLSRFSAETERCRDKNQLESTSVHSNYPVSDLREEIKPTQLNHSENTDLNELHSRLAGDYSSSSSNGLNGDEWKGNNVDTSDSMPYFGETNSHEERKSDQQETLDSVNDEDDSEEDDVE